MFVLWKCLCVVCLRGKVMVRVFVGFFSILIDVWMVKIKEFYFFGLILFIVFL